MTTASRGATPYSQGMVGPAKRPRSVVAGPYGHPFHPILVTIPIGAWIASLVFDIASRVNTDGSRTAVDAAYWLIGIGIVGAAVAAVFGLLDLSTIPRRTRAFKAGLTHLGINVVVLALFVADFLWRHSSSHLTTETRGSQIVLSAVAIVLLGVSGYIGGSLSYRFGVRVADEGTQAEGFQP